MVWFSTLYEWASDSHFDEKEGKKGGEIKVPSSDIYGHNWRPHPSRIDAQPKSPLSTER
jgi:hypothetical protein